MKKKKQLLGIALLLLCLLGLCGCGSGAKPGAPADSDSGDISATPEVPAVSAAPAAGEVAALPENLAFTVQYVRTDGYVDGAEYPRAIWITSAAELNDYYEANRDTYDLCRREEPIYADSTLGFLDAADAYDDAFFAEHVLILVVLEEGSGSVRHQVRAVTLLPPAQSGGRPTVQPVIERQVPEVGTCDMAEWHLFIAVDRAYGPETCDLALPALQGAAPQNAG